ncbi:MAG: hypothetical protein HRT87_09555, partial [Legionellales bacterium]|nr:hypothetical protein [Legionellales bacterium]
YVEFFVQDDRVGISAENQKDLFKKFYQVDTSTSRKRGGSGLGLAICILSKPKLLLLDEHTSALDPRMAELAINETVKYLTKEKIPCIMTTHNLDHALRFGNRLLVLKNGKIALNLLYEEKKKLTKQDLFSIYY